MRPESKIMKELLEANGITGWNINYISKGSMRGNYLLFDRKTKWTEELRAKLSYIGLLGFDGQSIGRWASNGGTLCIFVTIGTIYHKDIKKEL